MLSRNTPRRVTPPAADWLFRRPPAMGGASGEAYTNTVQATGMHPAAVLGRESIQNAVDERDPDAEKVLVRFRLASLTGTDKKKFIEAARLGKIVERRDFLDLPELPWLDGQAALNLVFVEDFYTTGLDGDPLDQRSRFYRLLLGMGDAGKVHYGQHNTGGSYGFGKSALSSNSGIKTVFAYSRYRDEAGCERTRLFGCGYFRSHEFRSRNYNGQVWFGRDRDPNASASDQIVDPLLDREADEMAARLGFRVRDVGEIGTSILIVDTTLEANELKKGVEEWWWPRLIENRLDVEVITPDGSRQVPRPKLRPDLRPFIEAYDIAIGRNQNPTPKREIKRDFNRIAGLELGTCALKVLDMPPEGEDHPVGDDLVDSVALIRVPGMVVRYHRRGTPSTPALVGVFVASDQIDDTLKLSEPPAHDRWDPESTRLRNVDDHHRKAVQAVMSRIYDTVRAFRKDASPPPPPRNRRLFTLERELANFLVGKGARDPIDHPTAPVHFHYVQDPEPISTNAGLLRARAEFSVRLKEDSEIESTTLRLKVKCVVLEDNAEGDPIGYDIQSDAELTAEATDSFVFPIEKDAPVTFTILTDPYDPLWTIRLSPDVEPLAMGAAQ